MRTNTEATVERGNLFFGKQRAGTLKRDCCLVNGTLVGGLRRPVSDGMLYAPKLSTRSKRNIKGTVSEGVAAAVDLLRRPKNLTRAWLRRLGFIRVGHLTARGLDNPSHPFVNQAALHLQGSM